MLTKGGQLATADGWQKLSSSGACLLASVTNPPTAGFGGRGGGHCEGRGVLRGSGYQGANFWVLCLGKERMQTRR